MTDRNPKVVNRIFWAIVIAALFCAGVLMMGISAHAQSNCGPYAEIAKVLIGKYKEASSGSGTINDHAVLEAFVSAKGTWTMVVTNTRGLSCIIAAGENWEYSVAYLPPHVAGQPI